MSPQYPLEWNPCPVWVWWGRRFCIYWKYNPGRLGLSHTDGLWLVHHAACCFHSECSYVLWNYCVLFVLCDCALHGWGCALLLLSFKVWCDLMGMCGHCKEIRDWIVFKHFFQFYVFYWKLKHRLHFATYWCLNRITVSRSLYSNKQKELIV